MYTMFNDIPHDGFHTFTNNMSLLTSNEETKSISEIIFVGTNPKSFGKSLCLDIPKYNCMLRSLLMRLKESFPNCKLVYIPHGADVGIESKRICKETGWNYVPVSMTIELYFLQRAVKPISVYGFLSTALFVLKRMFPDMNIINVIPQIIMNIPSYENYQDLSLYYENNSIPSVDDELNRVDLTDYHMVS